MTITKLYFKEDFIMKGLLNRKYVDMTVGDMLKLSGGVTLVSLVIMGVGTAIAYAYEKAEDKKWRASLVHNSEKTEID